MPADRWIYGRITLPVPEPHREYLRSIRRGERPLAEILDAWLHRSYLNFWTHRVSQMPR